MNKDILKAYICKNPFNYMEIHKNDVYVCCPSWLNTPIGTTNNLDNIYNNNDILNKIQNSIKDGSYTYCNKNNCPYLSELYYNNNPKELFVKKNEFVSSHKNGPTRVSLCFDSSCNLSCPSCRKNFMIEDEKSIIKIDNIMNDIQFNFGKTIKEMNVSGTSEPFVSKTFRNFLINFNENEFPNLSSIYLQTNGLLLDEKMWNKISKSQNFIKHIGISIDASKKSTYNIIRRGGSWNKLLNNLKFISQIECKKIFSFVVQKENYKEMFDFYNLINSLNPVGKYEIYYARINNWGTYTDEEFKDVDISNESHPNFNDFLLELEKITNKYNVTTNMNNIIHKHIKIKRNLLI